MPAIISVVKSVCVLLTAVTAVFTGSKIYFSTATSAPTSNPRLQKPLSLALKISQIRFSADSKNLQYFRKFKKLFYQTIIVL